MIVIGPQDIYSLLWKQTPGRSLLSRYFKALFGEDSQA